METSTVLEKSGENKPPSKIPDYLIYEVVKGKPIYYKGYKEVLAKTKTFEEIIMESTLQSWFKAHLPAFLLAHLPMEYDVTAGEMGINLNKKDKRGAVVSIFKIEDLVLNEHFSNVPPEVIFEIDVKAEMKEGMTELDYVLDKIEEYHEFGVKSVIWIFTRNKKVMVAPKEKPWVTTGWDVSFEVLAGVQVNLAELIANRRQAPVSKK
ncbi:MAG: Uma2 family endonuclease [Bacteroidota bacterium]